MPLSQYFLTTYGFMQHCSLEQFLKPETELYLLSEPTGYIYLRNSSFAAKSIFIKVPDIA